MCNAECCMTCCNCYKLPRWSCGIFAVLFLTFSGLCAIPVTAHWHPRAQLGVLVTFGALALLNLCLILPFLSRSDAGYYNKDGYEIMVSNGRYTANKGYYAATGWGHKIGVFVGIAGPLGLATILFLTFGGIWDIRPPTSIVYVYNTTDCSKRGPDTLIIEAYPEANYYAMLQCIAVPYNGTMAWSVNCPLNPEKIKDPFSYERKPVLKLLSSWFDWGNYNITVPCYTEAIATMTFEDNTCIVPNFPGLLENIPYSVSVSCNVY